MRTVTGLRDEPRGRVAVDVDGAPWRTLPADAVARAGLSVGLALDRERVRTLRRELKRSEALAAATGALRRRDLSRRALEERLARRGVDPHARRAAVETLERSGVLDDDRFAHARATALADRGRGDAAIRWDLEQRGVEPEAVERALAALEPEADRAERLVRRLGRGVASARLLAVRGFSEEAVERAVGAGGAEP